MLPVPRPNIESIQPYTPGKPIEQVVRELRLKGPIDKLASNENPLGPSPRALNALRKGLAELHYYPEDTCFLLRDRLADQHRVDIQSVMVGNGSVELILAACLAYLNPGDELVMSEGSFLMAKVGANIMGARLVEVPMRDYTHDLDRVLEVVTDKTKLIYLDNPINPLGTIATREDLDDFMSKVPDRVLVIVDEAYAEYIAVRKYPKSLEYFNVGKNVLILRTFSKVHGLAGLRVGYGITQPDIAATMGKVRLPFNVSRAAQMAAVAALDDRLHVRRSIRNNEAGKKLLYKELERLKVFYLESYANFVFTNFPVDSSVVFEGLQLRGVITRPIKPYGFPNALRVTVGTPVQNKRFVKALGEVLEEIQTRG